MAYPEPGRLFLFALSTGPHCRAARERLAGLPLDVLEADLLAGPERERALAELGRRNPALTFPTLLGGTRVVAGPLPDDQRRLAARFAPAREAEPEPQTPGPDVRRLYEDLGQQQAARGYAFNPDRAWTLKALAGLLVNEARYGYGSCPGRLATGRRQDDRPIVCPCDFRAEDVAKYGRCHCHLYFGPGGPAASGQAVPDRWPRPHS
ncbi:MAG: glutaredoxin [Candidatus Adiutrix sp.]|jgi:ferredoxin-thioredoxin reductase catalytic subunit|nr:glutaredoxin [Candidatus Adiutrix sp.]